MTSSPAFLILVISRFQHLLIISNFHRDTYHSRDRWRQISLRQGRLQMITSWLCLVDKKIQITLINTGAQRERNRNQNSFDFQSLMLYQAAPLVPLSISAKAAPSSTPDLQWLHLQRIGAPSPVKLIHGHCMWVTLVLLFQYRHKLFCHN